MCGIFGAASFGARFDEEQIARFERATDLVAYRGPDDRHSATFVANESRLTQSGDQADTFLGFRRLSIIDLSPAGRQPMTVDGRHWIVFNGEIFNYVELAAELESRGRVFRSRSDTEVILQLYAEWGEAAFEKMNGMWAFALLDLERRRLLLSRDRFSIKPLYVSRRGAALYFGSEIKQLLPFGCSAPNRETTFRFLKQSLVNTTSDTLFEGVSQIEPGTTTVVDLTTGMSSRHEYWTFRPVPVPERPEEVTEGFRELFRDSVRIRLRSDVPVCSLVSGGLDSSAITVTAQRSKPDLACFGVVSRDARYSEAKFLDLLETGTGLPIQRFMLDPDKTWDRLVSTIWHNDEPFSGFTTVAHNQVLAMLRSRSDATVVLSGQGGDETLCGYRKLFFFHVASDLRHARLAHAAANVLGSLINRTTLWQLSLAEAKRYLPVAGGARDPLTDTLVSAGPLERLSGTSDIRERQWQDIRRFSVPALTQYEDRNSMAHSLEIRLPFLDHRLVEYSLSLSPDWMIRRGWSKYVLRESIPELPPAIAWRRDKQGFLIPERTWLRQDFRSRISSMFEDSRLEQLGLARPRSLAKFYQRFLAKDPRIWYGDVTRLLTGEIWARSHFS